jgi:hypothetical protein
VTLLYLVVHVTEVKILNQSVIADGAMLHPVRMESCAGGPYLESPLRQLAPVLSWVSGMEACMGPAEYGIDHAGNRGSE